MGLGRAWYGVARLGLVWCGSIKKLLRKGFVGLGLLRQGKARHGSVWYGSPRWGFNIGES